MINIIQNLTRGITPVIIRAKEYQTIILKNYDKFEALESRIVLL